MGRYICKGCKSQFSQADQSPWVCEDCHGKWCPFCAAENQAYETIADQAGPVDLDICWECKEKAEQPGNDHVEFAADNPREVPRGFKYR
jgi:hypothetical protein